MQLLKDAQSNGETVYAALYELNDPELIAAMKALGARLNLILGNGAFKPPSNDENAVVRKQLKALGTIHVHDRMVSAGHFAHNKFAVFCDGAGNPKRVLTGSTNWTMTGLCTQANNGLIIEDAGVAGAYRKQWDNLIAAGNGFPPSLLQSNAQPKDFTVSGAKVSVCFAPTPNQQDLAQARDLIAKAQNGILFLFFNPGAYQTTAERFTLLQDILERHNPKSPNYKADLYVRGVVNQEIKGLTEPGAPPADDKGGPVKSPVVVIGGGEPDQQMSTDVLVPAAIKAKFHDWQDEVLSLGVMVHSKVVVLDPFGPNPVVMTGSHNLGTKASAKNDDNLIILQGNKGLAQAYALNIIAIYQEYRWRHYVQQKGGSPQAWSGLQDNDQWQQGYLTNQAEELDFWMGLPIKGAPSAPAH